MVGQSSVSSTAPSSSSSSTNPPSSNSSSNPSPSTRRTLFPTYYSLPNPIQTRKDYQDGISWMSVSSSSLPCPLTPALLNNNNNNDNKSSFHRHSIKSQFGDIGPDIREYGILEFPP